MNLQQITELWPDLSREQAIEIHRLRSRLQAMHDEMTMCDGGNKAVYLRSLVSGARTLLDYTLMERLVMGKERAPIAIFDRALSLARLVEEIADDESAPQYGGKR